MYDNTIWINGWWWLGGLVLIFMCSISGASFLIPMRDDYGPADQAVVGIGRGIMGAVGTIAVMIAVGFFFQLIGYPLGIR